MFRRCLLLAAILAFDVVPVWAATPSAVTPLPMPLTRRLGCCPVSTTQPAAVLIAPKAGAPSTQPSAPVAAPLSLPHKAGMIRLSGGHVTMGVSDPSVGYPEEEGPPVTVSIKPFWIDEYDVTNRQFKKFVDATGYMTIAQRKPDPKDFPNVPATALVAGSVVFESPKLADLQGNVGQWWHFQAGADWQHPEGPGSSIRNRMDNPVVQVSLYDALAYAKWACKKLPTEPQWEYAARGGLVGKTYVWGNTYKPNGKLMANTWQGQFPVQNTAQDGYAGTSPVGSFPPNRYGLYDMAGNVWQWTTTWYRPGHNPVEPTRAQSYDPQQPGAPERVIKGGSFLCAPNYCHRYRPAARSRTTPDTGLANLGFRCVRDVKAADSQS